MKVSGKGVIVILVFLLGIPALVDIILFFSLPGNKGVNYGMTSFLATRYAVAIPFYIAYLVIALAIMYFIKRWSNHRRSKDE